MMKRLNDEILENVHGGAALEEPKSVEMGKCSVCKETFKKSDLTSIKGKLYCPKCMKGA